MLSSGTPNALASLALPASVSPALSFSVCTRTVEVPSLVTTTSAPFASLLSAERPVCSKSCEVRDAGHPELRAARGTRARS